MKNSIDTILFNTCLLVLPLILSVFTYENYDNILNSGFLIYNLLLIIISTLVPFALVAMELYDNYNK